VSFTIATSSTRSLTLWVVSSLNEGKRAQERRAVALATIHQSKGLEWPVGTVWIVPSRFYRSDPARALVFLVRFNHGVMPSVKASSSSSTSSTSLLERQNSASSSPLEEERRLVYGALVSQLA